MSGFEHIGKEMDGVIRTPEGDIMTMSYIGVLQAVPPVYDKLFPMAVAGIMKGDITNGCQVVTETMAEIPGGKGATLLGMIQHQITTLGPEQCDAAKTNGTKSLLWLNRAASFICRLLRLLSEGMESNDAAYKAYEEVLKPFHGWMTQQACGGARLWCGGKGGDARRHGIGSEMTISPMPIMSAPPPSLHWPPATATPRLPVHVEHTARTATPSIPLQPLTSLVSSRCTGRRQCRLARPRTRENIRVARPDAGAGGGAGGRNTPHIAWIPCSAAPMCCIPHPSLPPQLAAPAPAPAPAPARCPSTPPQLTARRDQVPAFCDKMEVLTADVLKMLVDNRANFGSSA